MISGAPPNGRISCQFHFSPASVCFAERGRAPCCSVLTFSHAVFCSPCKKGRQLKRNWSIALLLWYGCGSKFKSRIAQVLVFVSIYKGAISVPYGAFQSSLSPWHAQPRNGLPALRFGSSPLKRRGPELKGPGQQVAQTSEESEADANSNSSHPKRPQS